MAESSNSHTVMPKKLAMALMEAGVKHFDIGGPVTVGTGQTFTPGIGGDLGRLLGGVTASTSGAQIQPGTNVGQLNEAYNQSQQGIQGQVGLTNALQPQAGSAIANQQTLANQLLQQSQGGGPNPAQMALNNATGANVANQAALMASQRGASQNPALVARNAAMQGANIQQNAIGQNAVLQAQQQLAAQQALAQLSGQQLGQTQGAQQQLIGATQGEQGILQGANQATNQQAVGMQSNLNSTNAALAGVNAQQGQNFGNLISGIGSGVMGAARLFKYDGGPVNATDGAQIEGEPEFKGNDKRNDVVPAMLSKGEIVLPNSVTQAPDMEKKAIEFLKHIEKSKGKKKTEYKDVVASKKACGGKA